MKTLMTTIAILTLTLGTANAQVYTPEEDLTYSSSINMPTFAPEEDIQYSASTDEVISNVGCKK